MPLLIRHGSPLTSSINPPENDPGTLLPRLLPNSVARGGTRTNSERHRRGKALTGRAVLGLVGIAEYGADRISSAVLSTSQPPLRGRKGAKQPLRNSSTD